MLLEVTIGEVFFFSRSVGYDSAAWWVFLALLLPLGWVLGRSGRRDLAADHRTWAVRWLVVFPAAVARSLPALSWPR